MTISSYPWKIESVLHCESKGQSFLAYKTLVTSKHPIQTQLIGWITIFPNSSLYKEVSQQILLFYSEGISQKVYAGDQPCETHRKSRDYKCCYKMYF